MKSIASKSFWRKLIVALKLYIFGLFTTLILASFLWFLLLFGVNPLQAPAWIIFLFYLTFFMIWTAIFALAGYYLKVWASNREVIFSHIGPSLRQAGFASFVLTIFLFFEQIKVLNWWVAGMLIFAIILFELFFRSRK